MMMRFIFASFLVATGFYLILGQTTRHIAVRRLLFLLLIVLGIVSIIFQNFWTDISVKLGVGNGTALLTYLVAFGFISYVISSYKWKRTQEEKLVVLARQQAIKEFQITKINLTDK
jgi:presenilin-like A22 family membrane protease